MDNGFACSRIRPLFVGHLIENSQTKFLDLEAERSMTDLHNGLPSLYTKLS